MADGGGLENRYGVTPIVGSNPTPSAKAAGQARIRAGKESVSDELGSHALTDALTRDSAQTGRLGAKPVAR